MKQLVFLFLLVTSITTAQNTYSIQGDFPNFPNSNYELRGYEGMQTTILSTAQSKEDGKFTLTYPESYVGIAQLYMNGAYQNMFLLNKENINLFWEDLTNRDGMQLTNSKEYDAFIAGMKTFQESEAKLAGWNYLLPLYEKDSIQQKSIAKELQRVAEMYPTYVKFLPETIWVRQYLLAKGLIEQMPTTVKTYNWRSPMHVQEFMGVDFKMLKHAGLYKDLIEGYTYLVERFPLEEIEPLLNQAIDKVVLELKNDPVMLQEITQHWFTFLESHSLVKNAEYLALKMLNQENCMLNEKSTDLFEQYRKMAVGKTAPDIVLDGKSTLKKLKNKYKLVVFGASWCPNCKTDYPKLVESYKELKEGTNLEIIYISVDSDKKEFAAFYKDAPFMTFCDGKGWESTAAKEYHVFATPTYILLDKDLKILSKIVSVEHLKSFLKTRN